MVNNIELELTPYQAKKLMDEGEVRVSVADPGPKVTPIAEVKKGNNYDLKGIVVKSNDINHFERSDGSDGQVRNITIQDETGEMRCALWGDKAENDFKVGDYVHIIEGSVGDGWKADIEVSVGWNSEIDILDDGEVNELAAMKFVELTLESDEATGDTSLEDWEWNNEN